MTKPRKTKTEKEAIRLKRVKSKKERAKSEKKRVHEFMEFLNEYQRNRGTIKEFYENFFKVKKRLNKTSNKTFRVHKGLQIAPNRVVSNYTSGPRLFDMPTLGHSLFILYTVLLGYFERDDMERLLMEGIENRLWQQIHTK